MGVWHIVNFQTLFAGLDLSAEHYHPDKLHWLKIFRASNGKAVGEVARNSRNLTKQSATLSPTLPVFDLGAGSRHVLQRGDAIQEERVSTKKIVEAGDILVSRLRSYLRQVAIVPVNIPKANVSSEFIVLRPINRVAIAFLLPFILSKQVQTILAWSQDGNEHPRFHEKLLLELQSHRYSQIQIIPPYVLLILLEYMLCHYCL